MDLNICEHALERMVERNITEADIENVLMNGEFSNHKTRPNTMFAKHEGVIVIYCTITGQVLTAYNLHESFAYIKAIERQNVIDQKTKQQEKTWKEIRKKSLT